MSGWKARLEGGASDGRIIDIEYPLPRIKLPDPMTLAEAMRADRVQVSTYRRGPVESLEPTTLEYRFEAAETVELVA